jgi:hypothetical protein
MAGSVAFRGCGVCGVARAETTNTAILPAPRDDKWMSDVEVIEVYFLACDWLH